MSGREGEIIIMFKKQQQQKKAAGDNLVLYTKEDGLKIYHIEHNNQEKWQENIFNLILEWKLSRRALALSVHIWAATLAIRDAVRCHQ